MSVVVNVDEAEPIARRHGRWGAEYRVLTPTMRERGGRLGVNQMRVAPGCAAVPFHWHAKEDEVFFVQSGRGFLRYGDELRPLRPGDCISCPAGSEVAHQICNPADATEDLVYLAIGPYDRHEVCGYPDNGKVMVRTLGTVGRLDARDYMDGEPDVPHIFSLIED